MIKITDKTDCCGCAGCYTICPQNCISMNADEEGFLYPVVDTEKCTECGLCVKVCPEINPVSEQPLPQNAYLVQHKNDQIRKESTSGGAFTAIAEYVISQGGIVFGVAYTENFEVIHRYVETTEELRLFRNSKYVQSKIGNTFQQAKAFLKQGKLVCFSGTPCQIEGLKKFLRREYENLITVDVVCRAVPSPLVLEKYLLLKDENYKRNISNVLFRDKIYGYKYSNFTVYSKDSRLIYKNGVETDSYLRSFFSNINVRPSCYHCSFKKRYRISDFTLWDCFSVDRFSKELDDDKGTTRILTHTSRANQIIEAISDKIILKKIDVELAVQGVREMIESVPQNPKREQFFIDLNTLSSKEVFEKYFPNNLRSRLEKQARMISYKLGIYQQMKKLVKTIYNNNSNQKR